MTRLPGRVVWDPRSVDRWLRRLAAVLPAVHDAAVGEDDSVGQYFNYEQLSYEPPRWATTPGVWERAVEVFHGPILEDDRAFIHRDYHPGNVLWNRADVAGVVDWQSACVGPPSVDIGHCRANFLLYAPELGPVHRCGRASARSPVPSVGRRCCTYRDARRSQANTPATPWPHCSRECPPSGHQRAVTERRLGINGVRDRSDPAGRRRRMARWPK